MELRQYAAYGFLGGVVGAAAVVLCSLVLHYSGIGPRLGVDSAITLASPDIYRPLFWGGLWGIPFGMMMRRFGGGLYLYGFIYFLAPLTALFLIFAPLQGMGFFALDKGPSYTLYLLLVNMPFGIVTAAAAKWVSAEERYETRLSAAHQRG
jgi:hypothetical protein